MVTFDAYICGMIIWLLLQYSPFPKDGVFSLAGSGRTLVRRHHVRAGFFILQFFCWSIVGVKIPLGDFQIRWTLVRTHQKKTPSLGGGEYCSYSTLWEGCWKKKLIVNFVHVVFLFEDYECTFFFQNFIGSEDLFGGANWICRNWRESHLNVQEET